MQAARFAKSTAIVLVFLLVYESLVGGLLPSEAYTMRDMTPIDPESMRAWIWLLSSRLVLALCLCALFWHFDVANKPVSGLRFGLFIGLLLSTPGLVVSLMQSVPLITTLAGVFASVMEIAMAGILIARFPPRHAELMS